MNRRMVALGASILAVLLLAAPTHATPSQGEDPSLRIINGQEVNPPGKYPFVVALVWRGDDSYNGQFCGGSLIGETWVLTAAHCVIGESAGSVDVVIGRHDLTSNAGSRIRARSIRIHPNYNDNTSKNDIAVIELREPYRGGTVGFPADGSLEVPGSTMTVVGWGDTDPWRTKERSPTELREVQLPLVSESACRNHYGSDLKADAMICAGGGGLDSCQGDSGGPMFMATDDGWIQLGVVSWGDGCGQSWPGVYTRVSAFQSWLTQVTGIQPGQGGSGDGGNGGGDGGGEIEGVFCAGRQATIAGTAADDVLVGTAGPDVIAGRGGNDTIDGLGGNDVICGGAGNDSIDAGTGKDLVLGGAGSDVVDGGGGNDRLRGGAASDDLHGGDGDDKVIGNGGSDVLAGGAGDDVLKGGSGDDFLTGAPGFDKDNGGGGEDDCAPEDDVFISCETFGDDGGADDDPGDALDPSQPATFRSPSLASGFVPDPWAWEAVSGGSIDVSYLGKGCLGRAAQAPDFRLTWSGGGAMLRMYFVSDIGDTTLIVNDPVGNWHCSDDWEFLTIDPGIQFDGPRSGVYDIWIGSYDPGDFWSGRFYITELDFCDPFTPC